MRRGFSYDAALCVSCKACSAACILENGLQPGIRTVYSWNEEAFPPFTVINLSLACNHCAEPACLSGCPAKAYTVDEAGAVIHHSERCMGCRYCTLKCPYDAPMINIVKGCIEKCHFCQERSAEGVDPACITACPTGALKTISGEDFPEPGLSWFPVTGIGPSLEIKGANNNYKPTISPPENDIYDISEPASKPEADKIKKEWSLLLFSLLVILSFVTSISAYFTGSDRLTGITAMAALSAMAVSLFHLGVKRKAWRAFMNMLYSPLSREIAAVTLLFLAGITDYLLPGSLPALVTPLFALLTLMAVDLVYMSADHSKVILLHSGQTFFSGVFAASFFAGSMNIFVILTLLAAGSVVVRYRSTMRNPLIRTLYYWRALTLPAVLMLLYLNSEWATFAAGLLFVTGVVADRALYYDDFKPENIREKISEHFDNEYENERDKQRQNSGLP